MYKYNGEGQFKQESECYKSDPVTTAALARTYDLPGTVPNYSTPNL